MERNFIVVEGLDGSGKTSQMNRLANSLVQHGIRCQTECEPSRGPVGTLVRRVLAKEIAMPEDAMSLLFAADRVQHIEEVLLPRLREGQCVLCDRYVCSNLAYQGVTLPMDAVWSDNRSAMQKLIPSLTVYVDTDPAECLRRISREGRERELYEEMDRLERVRIQFEHAFAYLEGKTIMLRVDGNQSEEAVAQAIWQGVWKHLNTSC